MFGQSVIVDMQVNGEREKKIESYTGYIFKELYKVNQYISFGTRL